MKTINNQSKIITRELRESLKTTFKNEVEKLPQLLSELDAKERVNIIMKLMPYLMPSVKAVHYSEGESLNLSEW